MGPTYWCEDLDLSGSRYVSCHVTIWRHRSRDYLIPRCHFL